MVEVQQSRDVCIDILRTDSGKGLTLMSNLKSADQILKVMDGYLCRYLKSAFGEGETEELLRCSVGFNARGRPADTRTPQQKESLIELLSALKERFPQAKIVGHYELGANKACPVFCASKEYSFL